MGDFSAFWLKLYTLCLAQVESGFPFSDRFKRQKTSPCTFVFRSQVRQNFARLDKSQQSPAFPPELSLMFVCQAVAEQPKNSVCCISAVIEVVFLCRRRGKTRPSATIFRETACMADTQAPMLRVSSLT